MLSTARDTNRSLQRDIQSAREQQCTQQHEHQQQLNTLQQQHLHLTRQLQERDRQHQQLQQLLITSESTNRQTQHQVATLQREIQAFRQQHPQSRQSHLTEFCEVPRDSVNLDMRRYLGAGGWGYVVAGKFSGQKVAVKCLHDLIREPEFIPVIRQEIGIMA